MSKPDIGPAAYDLLVRFALVLGGLTPLKPPNGSGLPADLQEILRGIYHFLGMEGVELVEVVDVDGGGIYHRAASLLRRCNTWPPRGRVRLPVLEMLGERQRIVLVPRALLEAFVAVHIVETNEELI